MELQPTLDQDRNAGSNPWDSGDRRELELELTRIKAEARAARLEARAAEIELMLRRSARGNVSVTPVTPFADLPAEQPEIAEPMGLGQAAELDSRSDSPLDIAASCSAAGSVAAPAGLQHAGPLDLQTTPPTPASPNRIASWEELMRAAQVLTVADIERPEKSESVSGKTVDDGRKFRIDSPQVDSPRVDSGQIDSDQIDSDQIQSLPVGTDGTNGGSVERLRSSVPRPKLLDFVEAIGESGRGGLTPESLEAVAVFEKSVDGENDEEQNRQRRRPTPWVLSVLAHAVALIILAGVTLSVPEPQDQIALSASAAQPSEEQVETMVLEQTEQPETDSQSQAEPITTVNPVGEIAAAVVDVTGPGIPDVVATPGDSLSEMLGQSISAGGASGDVSATFFGASGGGNHFVYLVDSSRSMDDVSRDGFDVARAEVLRAVESLTEKQRFYVVFFGEKTMRMRLGNASQPEPRSVYATDENKRALRRWAATISMQPGRWPEEGLEFAFTLRPDCIFLLTDGAMPDYVPEMIGRNNIVETLLDGPKPRSIIHTIGFHNPTGEAVLSKIAKENSGTYHFVPANVNSRR